MSGSAGIWRVVLTSTARKDIAEIIKWTGDRFGPAQGRVYTDHISTALEALTDGPTAAGVRQRDDIGQGLLMLRVARHGRRGRHVLMFRVGRQPGGRTIVVLRLLHDAMDLRRHLADGDAGDT